MEKQTHAEEENFVNFWLNLAIHSAFVFDKFCTMAKLILHETQNFIWCEKVETVSKHFMIHPYLKLHMILFCIHNSAEKQNEEKKPV